MKKAAVIMAGGIGERFWPMTSETLPKYALSFGAKETLLGATYKRLLGVYPASAIYVITAADHAGLIRKLLPKMSPGRILAEPRRRNTAGAVTYATLTLKKTLGEDGVLSFFPADAMIKDAARFCAVASRCAEYAAHHDQFAVIGIRPTYPATGYGYIEGKGRLESPWDDAERVGRFLEKPDLETAKSFLSEGKFLWNAGIFTWKIRAFERAMTAHAPDFFRPFEKIFSKTRPSPGALKALFNRIPSVNIDRLLVEKMTNLAVFPADFDWDDVGTWEALRRMAKDASGNVIVADTGHLEDVRDCVIQCKGLRITAAGIRNLAVIQNGGELLICDIGRSQDVGRLRQAAKKRLRKKT